MSREPTLIFEELGHPDGKPFLVGRLGQAFEGRWQRKVVFIEAWCETEDEARLIRDKDTHP